MTFCSKSDELELPRAGEIWSELGKKTYRAGETPKRMRLWLIARVLEPHRPGLRPQLLLLQLESGATRRVEVGRLFSKHFTWKRLFSPTS